MFFEKHWNNFTQIATVLAEVGYGLRRFEAETEKDATLLVYIGLKSNYSDETEVCVTHSPSIQEPQNQT